ncbi:DUF2243 domain-containing protein [Actinosynnema pretiosum subsp. pretiosum]|uniref:DUF2243 domain-containing protein n=1 Tax=Actinosynnema pretiosum subsp. pretiosum TaxID=103721 RepID=A0AA45L7I4_9PSEU|nr:hypothetical protein APASM_3814 [Actinosynnema pretiosum subsp. pretiosum]QUF04747.1 DUF2243 domain-containing protein [Actinosynnema pretiosum subsp. pretiosum]
MLKVDRASLVLGLGIGGFLDGIVIHQLLGWHHMLSGWYPDDPHVNMIGDGLFHLLCLALVVAGVVLLNRSGGTRPGRVLWGGVVAGWGVFNLAEGTLNHLVLGVHHVRSGQAELAYDLSFLALGAALVMAGIAIGRVSGPRSTPVRPPAP